MTDNATTPQRGPAPAASVIVPTRGGAARLPVLLTALCRQDDQDFEVIVVIDGLRPTLARTRCRELAE